MVSLLQIRPLCLLQINTCDLDPSLAISLISPDGISSNLTFLSDRATTKNSSTAFIVRAAIPSLQSGGTYTLRFSAIRTGLVISKPLIVLPPFRPHSKLYRRIRCPLPVELYVCFLAK